MGLPQWFAENWFNLLQNIGVIGALVFTGISLQIDAKVRRVQNLLTFTEHHRDIWTKLYERPELAVVLTPTSTTKQRAPTVEEELFVNLVVLHLNCVYQAMKQGMFITPEGMERDIRRFFTLPIPQLAWQKIKTLQDEDFVEFVDSAITD